MASGSTAARSPAHGAGGIARPAFGAAILLTGALALWHALRVARFADAANALGLLVALLAGALAADLLTGVVHWACDTWGDECSRRPGAGLIRAFREHHRRPQAMLEHDWVEVNGEAAAAAAAAFALIALGGPAAALIERPGLYVFAWSAISVSAASNQFHQWAHMARSPRLVRALQRAGFLLSPQRHARHHRAPRLERYCIATGWMNPLLDGVGFWRALERCITRATGAMPRAHGRSAASSGRRVVATSEATRLRARPTEEEA